MTCSAGVAWILLLSSCTPIGAGDGGALPASAALSETNPQTYPAAALDKADAIVRITTPFASCTGTLIAQDQVLTAHHCLAERDSQQRYLHRDVAVKDVRIELGGDYLPWGELGVMAVVAPPCGHGAGVGDIAVLVLEKAVAGAPTLGVQRETVPKNGHRIEPVGFGRCSDSAGGIRRHDRSGGKIEQVSATQFQLAAAICPGDSGGPGVDETHQILGVISRSAMDSREATKNPTEFTRVDRWAGVFVNAARLSEGGNRAELRPIGGCEQESLTELTEL